MCISCPMGCKAIHPLTLFLLQIHRAAPFSLNDTLPALLTKTKLLRMRVRGLSFVVSQANLANSFGSGQWPSSDPTVISDWSGMWPKVAEVQFWEEDWGWKMQRLWKEFHLLLCCCRCCCCRCCCYGNIQVKANRSGATPRQKGQKLPSPPFLSTMV